MSVCFVTAPLMARSGAYRSTIDLVTEGRRLGWDWSALIGVRPEAKGMPAVGVDGVTEFSVDKHGVALFPELRDRLLSSDSFQSADVVISLITQSDLAIRSLSRNRPRTWVPFVRGLPWPTTDEQPRLRGELQKYLWSRCIKDATEVWTTTTVLRRDILPVTDSVIVPPGIPDRSRIANGSVTPKTAIWAGRFDTDKQPEFFADVMTRSTLSGLMYGHGPLEDSLRDRIPDNTQVQGWVDPDELWSSDGIFVGTSKREAFGRSAAEAALRGLPIVIGKDYGCADLLYTDIELKNELVLDFSDVGAWAHAVNRLATDMDWRKRVSNHVHENATRLNINNAARQIHARLQHLEI